MTQPTDGVWIWVPVIRDPHTSQALANISQQLGEIMAEVKVNSDDLAALDTALDEVAQSLADKIASLALPDADLQPLLDDVEALRALSAPTPAPVEPPPA